MLESVQEAQDLAQAMTAKPKTIQEENDEATKEELDTSEFQLVRRRLGSSCF